MSPLRKTVAATVILTTGIAAVWLIANDSPDRQQIVSSPQPTIQLVPEPANSKLSETQAAANAKAATELAIKRSQVLLAFDSWAENYARTAPEQRAGLIAQGVAIAKERRPLMEGLIRNDPREAIAIADRLSPLARRELPSEVAENVEKMVSAKGDLEVLGVLSTDGNGGYRRFAHTGDESFAAYTYGKRLAPVPEHNTPLIGVSLEATEQVQVNGQPVERHENILALREDKFRKLSKAEVALIRQSEPEPVAHHCPVSGDDTNANADETGLDVGGEIVWLCKDGHIAPYVQDETGQLVATNAEPRLAYAGGPGEGAGSFPSIPENWTTGTKTVIAMPVRFPEQASNPFGSTDISGQYNQACTRLTQWSYGRISVSCTVTPILTLPRSEAQYQATGSPEGSMMNDAIAAADAAGYNASGKNFRSLAFTGNIGGYSGLGQVVGPNNWIKTIEAPTIDHELGHNLGLPHANSWSPSTSNPIGAGSHWEYGGSYNAMSFSNWGGAAYDTMMRFYLRWLTYAETHNVNSTGTYRIYDPEVTGLTAGRKHTIRIPKQAGQYYFIEFRPRATALSDNSAVDNTTKNGIRILRTNGSELIDVTPGSSNSVWDAALTVNQVFTDSAAGITITPTAKGGSGSDQYMDVNVTFSAPALYSGGVYELQPQCAPGLSLAIVGGADANGASLVTWASQGDPSQQWKVENQGGGVWELSPLCAPSRRLDVAGWGSSNGSAVSIWDDYNQSNQRWTLTDVGNGYFELTPSHATSMRLDVNGGANGNGTKVQLWQSNSSAAQRWRLLATGPQNGATYSLEPQCATGKRLAVAGGQNLDGADVIIWTSQLDASQQWKLEDQGNGLWELIPQCATARRLDVADGSASNGANIQIWYDGNGDNQRWSIVSTGNGYYELIPKHATGSRCDDFGAGNADGTNVGLWQSNGGSNQRWRLFRN